MTTIRSPGRRFVLFIHGRQITQRAFANIRINYRDAIRRTATRGEDNAVLTPIGLDIFATLQRKTTALRRSDINNVKQWLSLNDSRLQCVVSHEKIHSRSVEFGRAQYPELNDYADEVDVMNFLLSL